MALIGYVLIPSCTALGIIYESAALQSYYGHKPNHSYRVLCSFTPAKNGLEKWKIEAFVTKNLASGSQKFFHYWLQHTETIQMRCRNPLEPNIEAKSRLQKGVYGKWGGRERNRLYFLLTAIRITRSREK